METLRRRTRRMFAFGKGILGLDTGPGRLAVLPDPRELAGISAVVLTPPAFDSSAGLLAVAREAGVLVGTRADRGSEPLGAGEGQVTSGLDGLVDRLEEMRERGARFAVWTTAETDPAAPHALTANAQAAARFGFAAQRADLVPLIRVGGSPARSSGGRTATERACAQTAALVSLCVHLDDLDVDLAATVLVTEPAPAPNTALSAPAATAPAVADPLAMLPSRLGGVALVTTARSPRGGTDSITDALPGSFPDSFSDRAGVFRIGSGRPWPVTFYLGWPSGAVNPPTRIDQRSAHVQDRRRRSRG
ncbi:MAG TPA: class I fructose-bisphosphate aldolase [Pseudonocardia sp.]|jgi:hypothetical protein|nr:class I fructose-bisphosphate aldolase [Pseudonocardia sp.]